MYEISLWVGKLSDHVNWNIIWQSGISRKILGEETPNDVLYGPKALENGW